MDSKDMETPIVNCLYITQKWLYKLGYKYKNVYKDVFIDRYKWLDIIENCKVCPNKIEKLKTYIVELDKNGAIKPKRYTLDYIIRDNHW